MAPRPKLQRLTAIAARFLVALILHVPSIAAAQEVPIPVPTHYPMLLKALTFDRNLRARCGNAVAIGVVYQSRHRRSELVKNQIMGAGRETAPLVVDGLPVRMVPIDLSTGNDLAAQISLHRVNTLYVTPLPAVDVERITVVTRNAKVLTLTGVPAYVESGISIGVESKDGRPSLVINRRASRAEGADLDSQLLELTRIIR